MRRYFITQHPTFGSYANPIASKIEKSPYFYWWLALTLNKDYITLCDALSVEQKSSTNTAIRQVYEDFGDVRYEGDKYLAFTKWWSCSTPSSTKPLASKIGIRVCLNE